jgi:hypothetical protein
MIGLFAWRAGRLLFGIWFMILITSISGFNLALVASKPGHGGGGGGGGGSNSTSCTANAPLASVENNWAWGQTGSWGTPGQQLHYLIQVINYDVGCGSSTFVLGVSAPSGFTVSLPADAITLKSSSSGYLSAYITSPTAIVDGDYPLTVAVERQSTGIASAPSTTYYKAYSADTQAPSVFWPNPPDGSTVSGHSYTITASSSDDHAVKEMDLYVDNTFVTTVACDAIT